MPASFEYTVRDPLGKLISGTLEALSRDDAAQRLRRDGFQVLEIDESDGEDGGLFPKPVRRASLIYVTSQLALMVDTGITLSTALGSLAQQEDNPTLKAVLLDQTFADRKITTQTGSHYACAGSL